MLQLADEAELILTNSRSSLDDFGRLLHESWQIERTLTQKITTPTSTRSPGLSAGALGGKLLGAGGGGFTLFFVPPERRQVLRARLKNLLCVPFSFWNKGSHVVVYAPQAPSDQKLAQERSLIYA